MRKSIVFLAVVVLASVGLERMALAQTNPHRSANQFHHYLTVMGQEFWKGWANPDGPFDTLGSTYAYLNLYKFDTMLGLNCERRQLEDKPSGGANPDRMKAGLAATTFPYLWYCPAGGFGTILNDAKAIRFEAERHNPGNDTSQFDGFMWNGDSGPNRLRGRNAHDGDASGPMYARHSPLYGSDTSINCLVLDSIGHPGYFADSLWNVGFWSTQCNYPEPHWRRTDDFGHRQVGLRFRVRIDDTSYRSHPGDTVFTVHLVLRDAGLTLFDTTFLFMANDSGFLHSPNHFDTVTCRFVYPWGVDTSYVSLYWQGTHPITTDWMEALTTRLDTAPYPWYANMNVYLGIESPDPQHYNDRLSYETLTANGDAALKQGIDTIIQRYKGFFPLVETREEPCLASLTTIKRAIKLLRDRSNDSMEFITSIHDSIDQNITTDPFHTPPMYQSPGFFGYGYPNGWSYFLEGVRLGWLDSTYYADPKYFWTGIGVHSYAMPMPCRTIQQGDGFYQWEALYANTGFDSTSYGWTPAHWRPDQPGLFYDRDRYLTAVQAKEKSSLHTMRSAKRVCERNSAIGQKFFASMEFDTPLGADTVLRKIGGGGTRVPTAAEMRWGANIATSCGASGFYWWGYESTAGVAGMTGDVTSNWRWVKTAYNDSARWFDAHEEHFNAVKQINPMIRTYGDVLLHSNYIGDWTALEAISLSTAPFVGNSVHSVDDSDRTDVVSTLPDTIRSHYFPDSIKSDLTVVYDTIRDSSVRNRTFVHVSEWIDTSAGKSDTLLYITNMRTDDSYVIDTTTNPGVRDSVFGTFDRRYITMQMKAPHLVTDVADTANLMTMGKVRTPYVGAGDSLVVWLLPGDGVLVRLTPAPDSMKQMRIALNYPKAPPAAPLKNKYDHGNIRFSEYVVGVSPHPADSGQDSLLIPSSLYSYVGIKDTAAPSLHQDSLLFQKFSADRPERWRHQNWSEKAPNNTYFGFKHSLAPSSVRPQQVGLDSIAHSVTITTEFEDGTMNEGHIRFYDPFFVHDTTYLNQTDTEDKSAPFRPDSDITGPHFGWDPQHYGGVFLKQDSLLQPLVPNYAVSAYPTLNWEFLTGGDTLPGRKDYSFLMWHVNDRADSTYPDTRASVVFYKDSAIYTARYKVHDFAYLSPNTSDTGYSFNNQRKFVYIGRDSANNPWYVNTYASYGRIYVALGWRRPGQGFNYIKWLPEHLVSDWNNTNACFPAIAVHLDTIARDTTYSIVYQTVVDSTSVILRASLYHDSVYTEYVENAEYYQLQAQATPVIAAVELHSTMGMLLPASYDVIAYGIVGVNDPDNGLVDSGIIYRVMSKFQPPLSSTLGPAHFIGAESAMFPTIWARDSTDELAEDPIHDKDGWQYTYHDQTPVYLAWQEKDICMPPCNRPNLVTSPDSVWDIFSQPLIFDWSIPSGSGGGPVADVAPDPNPANQRSNVSKSVLPASYNNMRPCISGIRAGNDTVILGIAFETTQLTNTYVPFLYGEGVAVALDKTGSSWWRSYFFPNFYDTTENKNKPSITMTRYTHPFGSWIKTNYFYSLTFETQSEQAVENIALNDTTQRVTAEVEPWTISPQSAAMINGYDSNAGTNMLDRTVGSSRPFYDQNKGAYKIAVDHSELYDYRAATEWDTASATYITQGFGEIMTVEGQASSYADLVDCGDVSKIDSVHPPSYFMTTEPVLLPATGTLYYAAWVGPSDDSSFAHAHEKLMFRLDLYDTNNNFLTALDSFFICDTMTQINLQTRSVGLWSGDLYGKLKLDQISGTIPDSGTVQDILSLKLPLALKKSQPAPQSASSQELDVTVHPNPVHGTVKICVADLPQGIPATVDVVNEMGVAVAKLYDATPDAELGLCLQLDCSNLPSGTYYADLQTQGLHKAVQFSVQH